MIGAHGVPLAGSSKIEEDKISHVPILYGIGFFPIGIHAACGKDYKNSKSVIEISGYCVAVAE
jgi:hypothetical protein